LYHGAFTPVVPILAYRYHGTAPRLLPPFTWFDIWTALACLHLEHGKLFVKPDFVWLVQYHTACHRSTDSVIDVVVPDSDTYYHRTELRLYNTREPD